MDPVTKDGEKLFAALELTKLTLGTSGAMDGRVKALFKEFYTMVDDCTKKPDEVPDMSNISQA